MHPRVLLEHLPKNAVRKAYRTRVLDQRVGMGHLGVYVQLNGPADCIGNANVYRLDDFDSDRTFENIRPDHVPFYFATAPAEGLENPSPHHHVVLMLIALDWAKVAPWAASSTGERPPEYTAYKDSLSRAAVNALVEDFPSLKEKIVRVEASTALTTQHFTRSPEGAMYGHYHEVSQMGRYRPSQFSRVQGLIQVGQSVFAPGVLGATLSGYYGVGRLLGFERLTEELRIA
jgi:phytoene dehydrogenase-like protein